MRTTPKVERTSTSAVASQLYSLHYSDFRRKNAGCSIHGWPTGVNTRDVDCPISYRRFPAYAKLWILFVGSASSERHRERPWFNEQLSMKLKSLDITSWGEARAILLDYFFLGGIVLQIVEGCRRAALAEFRRIGLDTNNRCIRIRIRKILDLRMRIRIKKIHYS